MSYYTLLARKIKKKESLRNGDLQIKRHIKKTGTWAGFLRFGETIDSYKVISKKSIKTGT
jgi:hypothetical protein